MESGKNAADMVLSKFPQLFPLDQRKPVPVSLWYGTEILKFKSVRKSKSLSWENFG